MRTVLALISLLAVDPAFATEVKKDAVTEAEALKLENLDLRAALLQQQASELQTERKAFTDALTAKYHLGPKDEIDRRSHTIVRR